jgi:putative nucleotidyltransferase with HDIG domain
MATVDRQKIIELVERIPTFQQSVLRILALTAHPQCAPKDLVAVIEHDPILTIKVLKLVNSAYFGLAQEVTSVHHAVVYMGLNTIKNLAICVATMGCLPRTNKAGLNVNHFWEHSLAVAVIGQQLADGHGQDDTGTADFFVAGLLHDIGKLVLAHFQSSEYRQVLRRLATGTAHVNQVEKEVIGIDHANLGALIAEKWHLPLELIDGIRYHHDLPANTAYKRPALLTFAANYTAHLLTAGPEPEALAKQRPAVDYPLPSGVEQQIGAEITALVQKPMLVKEKIKKAVAFVEISR